MVIVVAVAFILAWSPNFFVNIIVINQPPEQNSLKAGNYVFIMLVIHLCGFINSCLNPFIYTLMSKKFRKSFKRALNSLFCNMISCLHDPPCDNRQLLRASTVRGTCANGRHSPNLQYGHSANGGVENGASTERTTLVSNGGRPRNEAVTR